MIRQPRETIIDKEDYVMINGEFMKKEEIELARQLRMLLLNHVLKPSSLYQDEIELLINYEFYSIERFHSYDNTLLTILEEQLYPYISPWSGRSYLTVIRSIEAANKRFEAANPDVIAMEKQHRFDEMVAFYHAEQERLKQEAIDRLNDPDLEL